MNLSLIYARSDNFCIGQSGKIPWRLPDEFAHFRRTTMGCPIVMGRRTYEDHASALPGRLNIVITRQADYRMAEGVLMAPTLNEALALSQRNGDEVFVIGGAHLFIAALPQASNVYETVVHTTIDGDVFIPNFDFSGWETKKIECHPVDNRHRFPFTVYHHKRSDIILKSGD